MLFSKKCQRCKGDIVLDTDPLPNGIYELVCVQCGYRSSNNLASLLAGVIQTMKNTRGQNDK